MKYKKFPAFTKTALCLALTGGMLAAAPLARADALSDLKAQIDALQKKVDELSAKQAAPAAAAPANAVTGGDIPGSFKLPGSNTSIKFGGYVKADAIFNSRSVGGTADQELEAGGIPLGSTNERNQLTMHARQTRFNMTTSTPSAMGEVKTFFEGDFFGGNLNGNEVVSNSNGLRMRHAFGSIGGLLVGQTWGTFMELASLPEVLDFGGPVGTIFVRQAQIRYTQKIADGQWAVALENPESNVAGVGPAGDDRFPDVVGRVNLKFGKVSYGFSALARQIRVDTPAIKDDKWGGAVGVSGVIPTFGKDAFRFYANYGNVLGRYVVGLYTDAAINASNKLDLSSAWLATASYQHWWDASLRSTIAVSGTRASFGQGIPGTATKSAQSVHANLIWSPVKNTDVGIEYIYGHRETEAGAIGVLNRIQTSAQYNF